MNNKNNLQKLILFKHLDKAIFLIKNYSELKEFLSLFKDNDFTKVCYIYRKKIHTIIYDEEENILIEFKEYKLANYFYLTLLIEENRDIVNYSYDFSLIQIINNENVKENNMLRKLINSIIILVLLDNYVNANDIDDQQKKEIEVIRTYNIHIKKNANKILEEFKIRSNIEYDLEPIYIEIIKSFFYNKKIEDYDYTYIIIKQLDLENIFLTDNINDKLIQFFKSDETYINNSMISKIADLNNKTINAYFILIKYILKKTFYIYEIPFLSKTRKIILDSINKNTNELLNICFNDNTYNERKNYIIKTIIDSNYYYNKYWKRIEDNLNIVLNYYKNYYFESKKKDIITIEEIINNKNGNYEEYINIKDLKEIKEMNNEYDIINYLYINDSAYKNQPKTEEIFKEYIRNWNTLKKSLKEKKIKKVRLEKKQLLFKYLNEKDNKKTLIEILGQDAYDYFITNYSLKKEKKDNDNNNNMNNDNMDNDNIDNDKIHIDISKLKEIVKYYNNYLFESKKDDIDLIETTLNNNKGLKNIYEKYKNEYKNDYENAKKYNDRFEIIDYLYNINNKDDINKKTEKQIKNCCEKWEDIEKMINGKKIRKMIKDIKYKIFEYFEHSDKNVILKIFSEEIYEFLKNESLNSKINNIKNDLKEILQYYQFFYPLTKKDDINLINQFINDNNGDIEQYDKYLKDLDEARKMNLKAPFIDILLKNDEEEITEEKIEKEKTNWIFLENMIKEGKFKNTKINRKKFLFDIFQNKNNKERLLLIFNKEIYDNFIINNNLKVLDKDNNNDNNKNNENKSFKKEIKENNKNLITITKTKTYHSENISKDKELIRVKDEEIQNTPNIQNHISNKKTKTQTISQQKKENVLTEKFSYASIPDSLSLEDLENKILVENMLIKSEIKFHINKKEKEIDKDKDNNSPFIIYDEINFGQYKIKSLEKFEELKNKPNKELEKDKNLYTKFKKFIEFLDEINLRLQNEFELEYNLTIKLEIELYNSNYKDDKDNLYCKYIFYLPDSNDEISFKEDNILTYKTFSSSQGFEYLISEINNENYKNIKYIDNKKKNVSEDNYNKSTSINNNISVNPQSDKKEEDDTIFQFNKIEQEGNYLNIKIIEFEKIIGTHKNCKLNSTCEFIKQLKSGFFLSGGTDQSLKIYTKEFVEFDLNHRLSDINNGIRDWVYSICERSNPEENEKKDPKIEFIACSNKEMVLVIYDLEKETSQIQKYELPNISCVNCIEMKPYHYVMVGLDGGIYFPGIFKNDNNGEIVHSYITQKTLRGGIRIKDNLVALTSNKVMLHGEDLLIFYNSEKRNKANIISHSIPGYSFTLNTNGLALMPKEKVEDKKQILICACTKYLPDQKNGILLVNPQIEEQTDIKDPFYDTEEFEVNCICPLIKVLEEYNNKETNFFLAGGFDNEKYEGKIKLYKVIFSDQTYKTRIEYLQDIEFEKNDKFEGFEGPISCITQSSYYGNILVSCYDGNVYLLSNPDLSFYENNNNL